MIGRSLVDDVAETAQGVRCGNKVRIGVASTRNEHNVIDFPASGFVAGAGVLEGDVAVSSVELVKACFKRNPGPTTW